MSGQLSEGDLKAFAALGIPPDLLERAGVHRVTDVEARELLAATKRCGDLAGIVFPYVYPTTGQRVTCRLRRDHPEIENGKPKDKYLCPFGDVRHLYFPPGASALLMDISVPVVIVESEKASLALTAAAARLNRRVLALGCGGCWGWRGPIGKTTGANGERVDETGPLPDHALITWTNRDVVILFDGNAATNPSVQKAQRTYVKALI